MAWTATTHPNGIPYTTNLVKALKYILAVTWDGPLMRTEAREIDGPTQRKEAAGETKCARAELAAELKGRQSYKAC